MVIFKHCDACGAFGYVERFKYSNGAIDWLCNTCYVREDRDKEIFVLKQKINTLKFDLKAKSQELEVSRAYVQSIEKGFVKQAREIKQLKAEKTAHIKELQEAREEVREIIKKYNALVGNCSWVSYKYG